jgi:ubiquinol-cytochrome c reductase cytochrome c subunit
VTRHRTTPRPGRRIARVLQALALVAAWAALTLLAQPVDAAPAPEPATADAAAGGTIYQRSCGVCHNNDGSGVPGTGVEAGPDLRGLPVAYVDLVIRTGRMPIVHPPVGALEEQLSDEERAAVVAWMTEEFDLEGEIPEVLAGDAGRGQPLWLTNCAACHSAAGNGGISADGTIAPEVTGVDATGIVEALRVGPFEMPRFGEEVLSEQDAADIAAYVEDMSDAETTPLGLSDIGRVYGGVVTGLLALAMVGALVLVVRAGRRAVPAGADGGDPGGGDPGTADTDGTGREREGPRQ